MASQLQFELVSPERLIFNKPVVMVTVPGGEGDYGVLADHAPMITTVNTGVVDVYETDEKLISERFFIAAGFAEVSGERCTLLAEQAIRLDDIDRSKVEEEISTWQARREVTDSDSERAQIEAGLALAQAKLKAITK